MRIDLFAISWNDAAMLRPFFRHYDKIVDRYVILDDGSDDESADLLAKHPRVETRRFVRDNDRSLLDSQTATQNQVWKESRGLADWVLIADIDEHFMLDVGVSVRSYLRRQRNLGVTLVPALGFEAIREEGPSSDEVLSRTARRAVPEAGFNKLGFFNPNEITEANFVVGRHSAQPTGNVVVPNRDELLIVHFKYLGREAVYQRHRILSSRLMEYDKSRGWGSHWAMGRDDFDKDWARRQAKAVELPRRNAASLARGPLWWSGFRRSDAPSWQRVAAGALSRFRRRILSNG